MISNFESFNESNMSLGKIKSEAKKFSSTRIQ